MDKEANDEWIPSNYNELCLNKLDERIFTCNTSSDFNHLRFLYNDLLILLNSLDDNIEKIFIVLRDISLSLTIINKKELESFSFRDLVDIVFDKILVSGYLNLYSIVLHLFGNLIYVFEGECCSYLFRRNVLICLRSNLDKRVPLLYIKYMLFFFKNVLYFHCEEFVSSKIEEIVELVNYDMLVEAMKMDKELMIIGFDYIYNLVYCGYEIQNISMFIYMFSQIYKYYGIKDIDTTLICNSIKFFYHIISVDKKFYFQAIDTNFISDVLLNFDIYITNKKVVQQILRFLICTYKYMESNLTKSLFEEFDIFVFITRLLDSDDDIMILSIYCLKLYIVILKRQLDMDLINHIARRILYSIHRYKYKQRKTCVDFMCFMFNICNNEMRKFLHENNIIDVIIEGLECEIESSFIAIKTYVADKMPIDHEKILVLEECIKLYMEYDDVLIREEAENLLKLVIGHT